MNKINKKIVQGFTMVEMIIVIAITAILAVGIAVFIKGPVIAYDDTAKRAEIADQAYLVIKKIRNDVRSSLPNSVRTTTVGNKVFLEMLTVADGGKYRGQDSAAKTGDVLEFTVADTSFDVLSYPITFKGGEKIVVANIGSPSYDAFASNNMTDYAGATGAPVTNIVMASKKFPLESVSENFYVVDKVVSYVCDKDALTLTKYWGYTISSSQPNNNLIPPLSAGQSALMANTVIDCSFSYSQGSNSRNGVVSISVKLKNSGQEATLYGETYVPNT